MKDISINISGKLDQPVVELFQELITAAEKLSISIIVVGATARDMVLHHAYGAAIERATGDIDFGINVPDWSAFQQLKQTLVAADFRETQAEHRLASPQGIRVDIVPFGKIQNEKAQIAWPPGGDRIMSVLRFQEAWEQAAVVRISDNPPIAIPVATPEGMVVLKLIAWLDRPGDARQKDAKDLYYLFNNYQKIPTITDDLYANQELMEKYDWDLTQASAYQLGVNTKAIVKTQTCRAIENLLTGKHESLSAGRLLEEMCERNDFFYDKKEELLNAFISGFLENEANR